MLDDGQKKIDMRLLRERLITLKVTAFNKIFDVMTETNKDMATIIKEFDRKYPEEHDS